MLAIYRKFIIVMAMLLMGVTWSTAYGSTTFQLTAGQTLNVGTVTVSNDATNLYINYQLNTTTYPDATLGTLHVWVGSDLLNLPVNGQGIPVPGQFCTANGGACFDATGLTQYTFTIPLVDAGIVDVTAACDLPLYVFTHGEVDTNGSAAGGNETAWGGNIAGTAPRWYFYGVYNIVCDFGNPVICLNETAFAKGGYVFTTDKRSNPENLPSLKLTKNRWGWAIRVNGAGITNYDIYAGAGLNKISNGVKVGVLTVNSNGSTATVTYTMLPGYKMEEVHLYVGDQAPTTVAPGQYGLPLEGYNAGGAAENTIYNIPFVDGDGDGMWIVGHAVVTTSCQ